MSNVWFITGSGRGIGNQIAKSAIQAGDKVVATGRNLEQLRASYHDVPVDNIALVELDVADESQAGVAVRAALKRFGRIDVLVNNAGYGLLGIFEDMVHISASSLHQHFKTITSMSPLQFQKVLRLQEALRLMMAMDMDAGTASRRVGYLSPSQFSREYARLFGSAPTRDIARLRDAGLADVSFPR